MLASQYKRCFWSANGDLDCNGPQCYNSYNSYGNYSNDYNDQNDTNYQYYQGRDQDGGSYPATYYFSRKTKCRQPSGPMIASGGFGYDAQWVSPSYNSPPRDSDTPRNNFNQGYDNYGNYSSYQTDSNFFNPDQKYSTYYSGNNQHGGTLTKFRSNKRRGRLVQSKLPKSFLKKRLRETHHTNHMQYGGGDSGLIIPYGARSNNLLAGNVNYQVTDRLPTQFTKDEYMQQKYGNNYGGNNYGGNNYNSYGGYNSYNQGGYDSYNLQSGGGFQTGQHNMYSSNPYNTQISFENPAQCYGGTQGQPFPTMVNINYGDNSGDSCSNGSCSGLNRYGNGDDLAGFSNTISSPAQLPDSISYNWSPDLRYRDGSNIISAQSQYTNLLNSYNQEGSYGQTDMEYTKRMQEGWHRIANDVDKSGCCGGRYNQHGGDATYNTMSHPMSTALVTPPFYSKWQCPNNNIIKPDPMDTVVGHRDCEANPNLTLNTGNSLFEAFESPINQGGAGVGDGGQDGFSKFSPSYATLLQQDWNNLQPRHAAGSSALQLGGGTRAYQGTCQALVPSNVQPGLSFSSSSPAPVQLAGPPAYQQYEVPYNQQQEAPQQIKWIPKVRNKLRMLSRELGSPYLIDRNGDGFAIWNESCLKNVYAGVFKRVELHDELIKSSEPYPHYRNLYTWIRLDVPLDQLEKIQVISPNITYDMTKRWVCVSGSSLKGNLAILTLVCMYLKHKLSLNQIQGYQLQKKYLWALSPKSGMYHPAAKRTFLRMIKESK